MESSEINKVTAGVEVLKMRFRQQAQLLGFFSLFRECLEDTSPLPFHFVLFPSAPAMAVECEL